MRSTTCAIDGWRDATTSTVIDGRLVAACSSCVPEDDATPTAPCTPHGRGKDHARTAAAVRRAIEGDPTVTTGDLCRELGLDHGRGSADYQRISRIAREVRRGA